MSELEDTTIELVKWNSERKKTEKIKTKRAMITLGTISSVLTYA